MRGWFRSLRWRRRPAAPVAPVAAARLSTLDAMVASYAGLSEAEWLALTDQARADYRWRSGLAVIAR